MTKAFLVLLFYGYGGVGNPLIVVSSTTMPKAYPYEECRARGQDFAVVNPRWKGWLCIVAPDGS